METRKRAFPESEHLNPSPATPTQLQQTRLRHVWQGLERKRLKGEQARWEKLRQELELRQAKQKPGEEQVGPEQVWRVWERGERARRELERQELEWRELGQQLGGKQVRLAKVQDVQGTALEWLKFAPPLNPTEKSAGEDLATSLSWLIPRKYRNDVIGDIMEDCADMRNANITEGRIKCHVLYQWLIAVITIGPMVFKSSVLDFLRKR